MQKTSASASLKGAGNPAATDYKRRECVTAAANAIIRFMSDGLPQPQAVTKAIGGNRGQKWIAAGGKGSNDFREALSAYIEEQQQTKEAT